MDPSWAITMSSSLLKLGGISRPETQHFAEGKSGIKTAAELLTKTIQ